MSALAVGLAGWTVVAALNISGNAVEVRDATDPQIQVASHALEWLAVSAQTDPSWNLVFPAMSSVRVSSAHIIEVLDIGALPQGIDTASVTDAEALSVVLPTQESCVVASSPGNVHSALVCGQVEGQDVVFTRAEEVDLASGIDLTTSDAIVTLDGYGYALTKGKVFRALESNALANIGASRNSGQVATAVAKRARDLRTLERAGRGINSGSPALFGTTVESEAAWRALVDDAESELAKMGKLPYREAQYGGEWPEATMSSKPVTNSEDWKQRYGVEPTGLTCHASADQSTMAGSFGCYSLDASGQPQWQVSTTTFVAASSEVFDVDGSVVSMREAGLYVVADGYIWPLDSLAAKVVPSKMPIDDAMPLIDAEMAKYDQFPWLNLVVPLAVAVALGGGAVALLVVARRRRRAAAETAGALRSDH